MMMSGYTPVPNKWRERAARRYELARKQHINALTTESVSYPYYVECGPFDGPVQWVQISTPADYTDLTQTLDAKGWCVHRFQSRRQVTEFWLSGWARRCGRGLARTF